MARHILLELTLLAVCWAACPGQAADPTLGADARRENLYAYRVRLIIQFSISPSLWESRFAYGLSHCSGDEIQMLRLLLWIRLPEPASRKEILTEWLSEKGSALNHDEIRRDLE
ncbi:MAG TPA: hypothetical protein VM492_12850, partial [Sumerlaeia bacterium]|nr:hypothetical protein [Sumerlaeia bacterium]